MRKLRRGSPGRAIASSLVGLWALASFFPVIIALLSSFKTNAQIITSPLALPSSFDFRNYLSALEGTPGGQPITVYLVNSVIATSIGLVIGISAAILAGHYLARTRGRWTSTVRVYFFILLTLPPVVTLIPLFLVTGTLHLRDSVVGLGVVYAAATIPLSVVLFRSFFDNFPTELLEAASIDGATETRTILQIVLPLMRGPIGTVALLQGIGMWNELTLAVVLLTSSDNYTTPLGLLLFHSQTTVDLGAQFAGLMIAAAPIIVAYSVFSKQFVEGLRVGAVK